MSKYIIEIPDDVQYVLLNGKADNKYYTSVRPIAELEELNSDYINEHFGELQDEAYQRGINDGKQRVEGAYQRGLNDAWKAARRIVVDTDHGGFALGTLSEIFDTQSCSYIMRENTAQQAIDKIKAYDDKHSDRIEVGDEAKWNSDVIVITRVYEDGGLNWCDSVSKDGRAYHVLLENVKKTGKHYDIQSILEAMRE